MVGAIDLFFWDFFWIKQVLRVVRPAGLEPARPYEQQILSLQRLPFRHGRI